MAAVERRDQRLNDRHRAVVARASLHASRKCASGICQWQRSDVSSSSMLRCTRSGTLSMRLGEAEIRRRGIDRIAAEDDEQIDLAGVHVGRQLASDCS